MKKLVKSFAILAVIAIALGSASVVFAQTSTPEAPIGFGGTGIGMRGNRGGRGSGSTLMYQNQENLEDGLLHDLMISAFAEALDMTVEELETSLAEGKTLAEIAGLPLDEFRALMVEIRTQVHDQAVEDGLLPGSQSGWVNSRGGGMGRFGSNRGGGQGLYGSGDCLID
jgi:hypothetical protein